MEQLRNLGALDHKGVVKNFELYSDTTSFYIVMEYIEGVPINKYFENKKEQIKKKDGKKWFEQKLV